MAKLSEKYETMVVYSLKNAEDGVKELDAKFRDMITSNGTLVNADNWGKRKLAYEIDDQTDGFYVIYVYECKPDFPAELARVMGITDGVMRYMTVLKEEAPTVRPKPVAVKPDADE
ncbi:MAG: 30S ribosomal protein S6 [Ruminococcus sp.]|jgi:small subunit ribosomal protein S6|nr:30S ribosomal protein S6 [Ruminococcus sp.]